MFDCDGVVLDSNRIKTEAFRTAALPFGPESADRLRAYHLENGGVSRYLKFRHFLESIVEGEAPAGSYERLLDRYATEVGRGLSTAPVASGLQRIRDETRSATWILASGGDQTELRGVFEERGLSRFFDGGIYGSPTPKDEILASCRDRGLLDRPALFLGDSRYDFEVASDFGLDFLFVEAWSEFQEWQDHQRVHGYRSVRTLSDLLDGIA